MTDRPPRTWPQPGMVVLAVSVAASGILILRPLFVEVWSGGEEARVRAMLLSAGLATLGTFLSAVVGVIIFIRQQRDQERARQDKLDEEEQLRAREDATYLKSVATALRSEIRESLSRQADFSEDSLLAQLRSAGEAIDTEKTQKMPMGVAMEENIIFDSHKDKIFEFPEELVRGLVRYYQNDRYLNRFLARMADGSFETLGDARKKRAVVQYIDVVRETILSGLRARTILDAYLVSEHDEDKDVSAEMTKNRAAAFFDGFPSDDLIAETMGPETDMFLNELKRDAPDLDTGLERMDRYFEAVGLTPQ